MEKIEGVMSEESKDAIQRLRKIEGQVRGIQKMVEDDRYCIDILTQIAAVKAALDKVGLSILRKHTKGCVRKAMQSGEGNEIIDELMDVIKLYMK